MSIDEIIVLTSKEIITQISNLQSPISNDEDYILYPNPNYTPITDTLPDGTLVAYDAVTDMWSTRDMRIYRKTSNGTWIKKFISVWDKFVRQENMHSRYPQVRAVDKPHAAHLVTARAWIGPVPGASSRRNGKSGLRLEGKTEWQVDHIDGNNRNFSIDNLRLLPTWMNHRDGGFLKKLRNQGIDPTMYATPFLLRFFDRMEEFKSTHSKYAYCRLTRTDLLKLLVEPELQVGDPHARMEYDLTHHCEI